MKTTFFWFRRDLRLEDNAGLYHALKSGTNIQCVFIFDREILDNLGDLHDRRVTFIHNQLEKLNVELAGHGSTLLVKYGHPPEIWKELSKEFSINAVYTNHDYEPYAKMRDENIATFLKTKGITFKTYKDQVIFEKDEVVKDDGTPYGVFTPYMKRWKLKLNEFYLSSYPTEKYVHNLRKTSASSLLTLTDIGFKEATDRFPDKKVQDKIITHYSETRDIPSVHGTSRLSVHLRFGTISIRALYRHANSLSEKFGNELIWREFYMMILWQFPNVVNEAYKPQYNQLLWRNDETAFHAWCEGRTGYPIVDAGMRELNATGWMHNRVRMITAMFLTKYLLIDWRWGEAYFAEKLIDYELSSNNGGWQWSAGTGVDAAPYFRIFNMDEQARRFDPEFKYIRKWVPEFEDFSYPKPIVDYKMARERCLKFYKTNLTA